MTEMTVERKNNPIVHGIDRAGSAAGRFACDLAYMELMPKDVKYSPAYLNDVTLVSIPRAAVKAFASFGIAACTNSYISFPPETGYFILVAYLAADALVGLAFSSWKTFSEPTEPNKNNWYRDDLKYQLPTFVIGVPYITGKYAGKGAAKGIAKIARRLTRKTQSKKE